MWQKKNPKIVCALLLLMLAFSASAQTKRKAVKKKSAKRSVPAKTATVVENDSTPVTEVKKNARPESENQIAPVQQTGETVKTNSRPVEKIENKSVYFYEFSKPEFLVSKIFVEHDENGKGKITLQKKDFGEPETDPLQLSPAALERVKAAWTALNFLDSTEDYQYEKDYSHLGTMKFTMKKDGRERVATFNYTANKDAKTLMDEYRKISQQFIWIFDINVARENQPLDAPRLIDTIDSLIRRNEVSDAAQMILLFRELSNDERIPLIARNHATKIIERIEKEEKKKESK